MKKTIMTVIVIVFIYGLTGCATSSSTEGSNVANQPEPRKQTAEEHLQAQKDLYQHILVEDNNKLTIGSDNRATIESIEAVFQPKSINDIDEITDAVLREPGRPYYFRLKALFKGHDANAKRIFLQDLVQKETNTLDTALGVAFGIDTNSYPIEYFDALVSTIPTEVNATATFYIVAVRFVVEQDGRRESHKFIMVRFIRNVESSPFNPSNFIVASGSRFITVNDARVTTQEDVMLRMMTGGAMGGSSSNAFDPIIYPLVDLMDARLAMDKKNIWNDYTFPTVRVKYVSEVIFKGQSNTVITVSTDDNVLTERMNFTGRASSVNNGQRIRIYYTIAKDPLEIWEIQAIERL